MVRAGLLAGSLQQDRHNMTGLFVATGSEQTEKLVSMLLLDVSQQMFGVDKLANEEEVILLCVCLEGKIFTDINLPSSSTGINPSAAYVYAAVPPVSHTLSGLRERLWA